MNRCLRLFAALGVVTLAGCVGYGYPGGSGYGGGYPPGTYPDNGYPPPGAGYGAQTVRSFGPSPTWRDLSPSLT